MTLRRWALMAPVLVACGPSAAIQDRALSPDARAPVAVERVALPVGTFATAAWMSKSGAGLIATRDGRLYGLDPHGNVSAIETPYPGPPGGAATRLESFDANAALALFPGGALVVDRGFARRETLPAAIATPRAFASLAGDALWATADALYAKTGDRWLAVETATGSVRGIDELVAFRGPSGSREAWVRAGARLQRVRIGNDGQVVWVDSIPGLDLGAVTGIAGMDEARLVALGSRGVTVVGPDRATTFHRDSSAGPAQVVGGGGGFAYVGWDGELLRTDGDRWERLLRGVPFGAGTRIAVDGGTGATALIVERTGGVLRVESETALDLVGLADGEEVFDSRIELEAVPPRRVSLTKVEFLLDDKPLASRSATPWGIGADGAPSRELDSIGFGPHRLDVRARLADHGELRRHVRFLYSSPLARVPSYESDVAPLFFARCTPCHVNGGARSLATYQTLRAQSAQVRASVRQGRMPPDLLLDDAGRAVFTAWVDGGTPP